MSLKPISLEAIFKYEFQIIQPEEILWNSSQEYCVYLWNTGVIKASVAVDSL